MRAYTSDAKIFEAWCQRYGFRPLPATPEAVAAFLVAEAEDGRAASTLGRRIAAIRYAHKLSGHPDPTDDEGVRAAMAGARRRVGVAPTQKAAATAEILAALLMRTRHPNRQERSSLAGARVRRAHFADPNLSRSMSPISWKTQMAYEFACPDRRSIRRVRASRRPSRRPLHPAGGSGP